MWQFFTDHNKPIADERRAFWARVVREAGEKFQRLRRTATKSRKLDSSESETSAGEASESKSKRPRPDDATTVQRTWASNYLSTEYKKELDEAHQQLRQSFNKLCPKLPPPITPATLTLIICFDEARHLCTSSASEEYVRNNLPNTCFGDSVESEHIPFSNFRAMRRALRFLRLPNPTPRIFGLFTDTTRLHNFQPRLLEDRSLRLIKLPGPGMCEFDPINMFTSIDAHSQIIVPNDAISDPKKVAEVERLLKFGRAGWYSLYIGKSESSPQYRYYTKDNIRSVAIAKLLDIPLDAELTFSCEMRQVGMKPLKPKMRLRLLALLGPRLAINAGPYTSEAVQMVSSHLAVLLRTDEDGLQTYYPPEPILAEASAEITKTIGWTPLVRGLYDQIQNGIVSTGFRGELLTKILLLMAMDDTPKPDRGNADSKYWKHTQPVKVIDFLNNWVAAPDSKYRSFSDALKQTEDLKPNSRKELQRFLDGYVFFTHFVRLDCNVSPRAIVCAWNQGAAIMAKEGNHNFDHVIPVMLAGENGAPPPTFGPLYNEWSEDELKRACSNISCIFINSKNYKQDAAAEWCRPTTENFEHFAMFNSSDVMFLSIAQDFGPHQSRRETYVNIKGRGGKNTRQFKIVLKGLGPETYQCLRENRSAPTTPTEPDTPDVTMIDYVTAPHVTPMDEIDYKESEEDGEHEDEVLGNSDRANTTRYLRMLRHQRLDYLPDNLPPPLRAVMIDSLKLTYSGQALEIRKEVQGGWDRARSMAAK